MPKALAPETSEPGGLGPTLKLPFDTLIIIMELLSDHTLAKWAVTSDLLTEPAQRLLYGHLNEESLQRMQCCILTEHASKGCA